MPDWFYRTVSRPLLFRLPAERARGFALGVMGLLARLPLGPAVIDFLGHMRADARLTREVLGLRFATPVGIGPGLDARGVALPALARFGVGFLEVGPVTLAGGAGAAPLSRRADQEAIWRPDPPASLPLAEAMACLREARATGVRLVVHVGASPGPAEQALAEQEHLLGKLTEVADVLVLAVTERDHLRQALAVVRGAATPRPVLFALPADTAEGDLERLASAALEEGASGLLLDASLRAEPAGRVSGLPAYALALRQVRRLRERYPGVPLVASGGAHEPEQALELMQAGADLLSTDTGLIYTGPGLPKRVNEAVLYAHAGPEQAPDELRPAERTWFWTALMGAGMLIGGVLALLIAATRVVLPYDEDFVGLTRAQLDAANPRLLAFLAHDRVSLAGAMMAIAVMYLGLSVFGIRRGLHWAQQSVFVSAFAGFATFFLFLGYGYFDPFHAFVTNVLLQFLLLGLHAKLGPAPVPESPQLCGDWRWRVALWGQLVLIGHALALMVAGVTIGGFGVTRVFVPEDLDFMRTTREALQAASPKLLPLIAHDRATFGGMLVSLGLAMLLPALWGIRPCSAWLWWTMLLAAGPGYAAAIGVHLVVGYTDLWHLTPAYGGLAVVLLGLALTWPLMARPGASEEQWRRFSRGTAR